ncbi:MAG: hypothetical protein CMD33_09245 [Flavobacteriales bacterium]|nr:hypothetical protein [Flavobacteriales bacterium]
MTARTILCLFIVGICFGCSVPESVQSVSNADVFGDPFELLDASVEGDELVLLVQYSGGSKAHDFALLTSGAPTKSLPRQVLLSVNHNSHGDRARAMITEERKFDLMPYRDPRNSVVHIRIQGVENVLVYRYAQ